MPKVALVQLADVKLPPDRLPKYLWWIADGAKGPFVQKVGPVRLRFKGRIAGGEYRLRLDGDDCYYSPETFLDTRTAAYLAARQKLRADLADATDEWHREGLQAALATLSRREKDNGTKTKSTQKGLFR